MLRAGARNPDARYVDDVTLFLLGFLDPCIAYPLPV
jgi:hypothetical protein